MGNNTTAAGAADRMFLFRKLFVEFLWMPCSSFGTFWGAAWRPLLLLGPAFSPFWGAL